MAKPLKSASRKPAAAETEHPGLKVIGDVASYLAAGIGSDEVLAGVAGALRRGLTADPCRIWVRTADGSSFRPFVAAGDAQPGDGYVRLVEAWVAEHSRVEPKDGRIQLRFPLVHEGERLGLLEAVVPSRDGASIAQEIVSVVANILSPLLWSIELSEDLASEVALRTREIDAQRRFTTKIVDSLPVGLYVINQQFTIQAWNRKRESGTTEMTRGETIGRSVFDVFDRQPRELLQREFDAVFATGRMEQVEVESSARGEPRHYRITKIPMRLDDDEVTHVIAIGEDIADWKNIQRQIAQTEKLAAVGQLAAGVMHEINNPLATIGACVEALTLRRDELEPRGAFNEYLGIIDSELERCKEIVDGLLDFSRPKARLKKPVNLNQLVEDALFLVKHHDRIKRIQLEQRLAADLPEIEANAKQLLQVFLDLMLNAIDSMEDDGVLTVATAINPERADEVYIEIQDTGAGIAREDIPKIFEPFFTTKPPGRGTGLGLSITYGIVAEHRGRIHVDSVPGRGSIFQVYLPMQGRSEEGA